MQATEKRKEDQCNVDKWNINSTSLDHHWTAPSLRVALIAQKGYCDWRSYNNNKLDSVLLIIINKSNMTKLQNI